MTILNFNTCSRCVYPSRVLLFLVASLLLFIQPIPAQYTSPAPGKVYMWNYIADKTLFVRQASQFYSLDLTPLLSGNGNLVWKTLSTLNGPVPELELYQPIGITADSQAVISFNPSGTVSAYALASDTWSPPLALPAGAYIYDNHYVIPMTDPRTGIVYIEVKSNDVIQMLAYDPATKTRTFIPMPLTFRAPYTAYYMTWSYYMDGLVFFDSNPLDTQVKFQIYRPASNSWNYLTWNGTGPNPKYTPSINGCMVSAYNGRKIIIVGGQSGFDTAPGVFIIDAATLTWTEGPPVANGRGGMACATAGDYLVLSGGAENFQLVPATGGPLFFNLKTNSWGNPIPSPVTTNPPGVTGVPPPPASETRPSPSGSREIGGGSTGLPGLPPPSKNNAGAIGGGVAGGVVVIGVIGFIFFRRRKQRHEDATSTSDDVPNSMGGANGGKIELESAQDSSYTRSEHKEGADQQNFQQDYPVNPGLHANYGFQGNTTFVQLQPQQQQEQQELCGSQGFTPHYSSTPVWFPASPIIPRHPKQQQQQQPNNLQLRESDRSSPQFQQDARRSGAPQDRS